jgi:hypothetical protein
MRLEVSSDHTPTVFISSTIREFKHLRGAIAYTLRKQGFNVQVSEAEDFEVQGNTTAVDECLRNAANADFYVLIVGGNTGHKPDGVTSITRSEYRSALGNYQKTGRSRLMMFLVSEVEQALDGSAAIKIEHGIDDEQHLRSFIEEIQTVADDGSPNYLKRFKSFVGIIDSISHSLNAGNNLGETLIRRRTKEELLQMLSICVARSKHSALPYHQYMSTAVENVQLDAKDVKSTTFVSRSDTTGIIMATMGRKWRESFAVRALQEIHDRGVFLEFDPVAGQFENTEASGLVQNLLNDVQSLGIFHEVTETDWDSQIYLAYSDYPQSSADVPIPTLALAQAFRYYNTLENIFMGASRLVEILSGIAPNPVSYVRKSGTPFGAEMESNIKAERVTPSEVMHLIESRLVPFGDRRIPEDAGISKEELIKTWTDSQLSQLEKIARDSSKESMFDADILRPVLEEVFAKLVADPSEGIDELPRT